MNGRMFNMTEVEGGCNFRLVSFSVLADEFSIASLSRLGSMPLCLKKNSVVAAAQFESGAKVKSLRLPIRLIHEQTS